MQTIFSYLKDMTFGEYKQSMLLVQPEDSSHRRSPSVENKLKILPLSPGPSTSKKSQILVSSPAPQVEKEMVVMAPKQNSQAKTPNMVDDCCICLEAYDDSSRVVLTECQHVFHSNCLR